MSSTRRLPAVAWVNRCPRCGMPGRGVHWGTRATVQHGVVPVYGRPMAFGRGPGAGQPQGSLPLEERVIIGVRHVECHVGVGALLKAISGKPKKGE